MTPTPTFAASQAATFARVRPAHLTAGASFPTPVTKTARPTGTGIVPRPNAAPHWVPNYVAVKPFGTGADNATLSVRVVGYRPVGNLWVPQTLFEADCVLSAFVGQGGYDLLATDRVADTIADPPAGKGTKGVDCVILTPADDSPAEVLVDCKGCPVIEVQFKLGTATGANALVAVV